MARHLRNASPVREHPIVQSVPVKLFRTADVVTVAAPMPGLEAENLIVDVTADGRLVLCGQLRAVAKDVKELLVDEWGAGPYYRELDLPAPVDGENTTVTYGNGVLVVALPVAPRMRPARLGLDEIGLARGERVPPRVAVTHRHRPRRSRTR
jgi:HSP20 family protein